jgi:hypothetical protein
MGVLKFDKLSALLVKQMILTVLFTIVLVHDKIVKSTYNIVFFLFYSPFSATNPAPVLMAVALVSFRI